MSTSPDIPKDELEFARLAGLKLSMALDGMFTTGTGVMLLRPSFSATQHTRLITALIDVLHSTGCRPGSEAQSRLARQTEELRVLFSEFHDVFLRLADWRNMELAVIQVTVNDLATAYWTLKESLRTFLESLGLTVDFAPQRASRDALPGDFLREVCRRPVSQ
jgi:hypothetical protein